MKPTEYIQPDDLAALYASAIMHVAFKDHANIQVKLNGEPIVHQSRTFEELDNYIKSLVPVEDVLLPPKLIQGLTMSLTIDDVDGEEVSHPEYGVSVGIVKNKEDDGTSLEGNSFLFIVSFIDLDYREVITEQDGGLVINKRMKWMVGPLMYKHCCRMTANEIIEGV